MRPPPGAFTGPASGDGNEGNSWRNKTRDRKTPPRLFQFQLNAENWPLNRRTLPESEIQGCVPGKCWRSWISEKCSVDILDWKVKSEPAESRNGDSKRSFLNWLKDMSLSTGFCTFFAKINIQKHHIVDLFHISCADLERSTGLGKVDSQLLKTKK